MAEEKKQTLVYSIIEFLNDSIADGTVKQEDQESLEVASKSDWRLNWHSLTLP